MSIPEEFLHFIWQFRLYGSSKLQTRNGDLLEVIRPGILNRNAGPDFLQATLMINHLRWIGNVEIHIKSSDWLLHKHQDDESYDNVILHVVYTDDEPIYRTDGTIIPVFVLQGLFSNELLPRYQKLIYSAHAFPCKTQVASVNKFVIDGFLTRLAVDRLMEKSAEVYQTLHELKGNWDETFYHFLARSFGMRLNVVPMEMLVRSLPQKILAKHKDNALQIEALMFGQAGFLEQSFVEGYPQKLKMEYKFLRNKYGLEPMSVSLWKFMRMRPQNFPTLRLAQFSSLMINSSHLFSKVMTRTDSSQLIAIFEELRINPYWQTHYHFNKEAKRVGLHIGKEFVNNMLINTFSVFLFAYGRYIDQPILVDRAITLLEYLPGEHNSIIKLYADAGIKLENALKTQAILGLYRQYCLEKKCLTCGIGTQILKPK
ncbi:MAG: DUF2851 family protein [Pedobacter sp.]|nr:MAG: DUF2851 family protein [Pedobacter sp.]